MYILFSDLLGLTVVSKDDSEGAIEDLYLDDESWTVRYTVVEIGAFLVGHQILLSTESLGAPDLEARRWPTGLTKTDFEAAPDPDSVDTVGDQQERRSAEWQSRYPSFLLGPSGAAYTPILAEEHITEMRGAEARLDEQPVPITTHLRSMAELCGYGVAARDGEIGEIGDFLINPESWKVEHVLIDTGEWLPGKQVILPNDKVVNIDWERGTMTFDATKAQIEASPEPESISGLKRDEDDEVVPRYISGVM